MLKNNDIVYAVFAPQNRDDLKPGAVPLIGLCLWWEALWIIDEGSYQGDWAMGIWNPEDQLGYFPSFLWVPEKDLIIKFSRNKP